MRPSPTGVHRGLPVFLPVVSSNAYPGSGRPTHRKRELDGRVQQVFLERVNDPMLHCLENHRDLSGFCRVAKELLSHRLAGCLVAKLHAGFIHCFRVCTSDVA
jgi:hypothetical protein